MYNYVHIDICICIYTQYIRAGRQADRQKDRQTDTHTQIYIYIYTHIYIDTETHMSMGNPKRKPMPAWSLNMRAHFFFRHAWMWAVLLDDSWFCHLGHPPNTWRRIKGLPTPSVLLSGLWSSVVGVPWWGSATSMIVISPWQPSFDAHADRGSLCLHHHSFHLPFFEWHSLKVKGRGFGTTSGFY